MLEAQLVDGWADVLNDPAEYRRWHTLFAASRPGMMRHALLDAGDAVAVAPHPGIARARVPAAAWRSVGVWGSGQDRSNGHVGGENISLPLRGPSTSERRPRRLGTVAKFGEWILELGK